MVQISRADDDAAPGIRAVLDATGLMAIDDAAVVVTARDAHRIVGCAAVERHGEAGLLRSVAVDPAWSRKGIGRRLVAEAERMALAEGISPLYLLTEGAEEFFASLGYAVIDRERVPEAVRASGQFASLCPVSATAMYKSNQPV